jgi:hypothetical protein
MNCSLQSQSSLFSFSFINQLGIGLLEIGYVQRTNYEEPRISSMTLKSRTSCSYRGYSHGGASWSRAKSETRKPYVRRHGGHYYKKSNQEAGKDRDAKNSCVFSSLSGADAGESREVWTPATITLPVSGSPILMVREAPIERETGEGRLQRD